MPSPTVFVAIRQTNERRLLAVLLWATALPPALLAVEELTAGHPIEHVAIRSLPALVALAWLFILARSAADRPVREWSHWPVLAVTVALLVSSAARPETELAPLRSRLLGPALIYLLAPSTMFRQAGPSVLLSVAYAVMRAVRLESVSPLAFANDLMFLVVLNWAGILRIRNRLFLEHALDRAWQRENDARLAAERARDEVRTLEGIIPICMHCRQLRTDSGEWQRLERYVRDRTGAQFSHGLCPECLETHYPEVSDEAAPATEGGADGSSSPPS